MWVGVTTDGIYQDWLCPPKWETLAHFACWNVGSAKAAMCGSYYVHAHASIVISTDFRVGFLPCLFKQAEEFSFFAVETVRRDHNWSNMFTLLESGLT